MLCIQTYHEYYNHQISDKLLQYYNIYSVELLMVILNEINGNNNY